MKFFRAVVLLLALLLLAVKAADPGETRCGATGYAERFQCFGSEQFGNRRCTWQNTYQPCSNTNKAPACNVGDTKCGADGKVQYCMQIGNAAMWQPRYERCAADRDPADNAPPGYGQRPYDAPASPSNYGGYFGGSSNAPAACSVGQRECGDDRQIRRCVAQNGRAVWQTEPGSRCGGQAPGMRN